MALRFTKMHGLGNDYVYVNTFVERVADPAELSRRISDRHRGAGSDGLILIGPPDAGVDAHVRMRMFNADGSESEMCGNGVRCVAKYAYERGLAKANPVRALELAKGPSGAEKVVRIRVDMGAPILSPEKIPVNLPGARIIRAPITVEGRSLEMTCVSMGNPHAVIFVDDLSSVPLATWGPAIENHPLFPQRVNAHFVQIRSRTHVDMVTWERGSGATQACGTGACAVCVAGVLTEQTARRITAKLPGGELELEWDAATDHVFKTGPATEVYDGIWLDAE
jgi:diaminopimelate epimerase